jgi:hypothetical protein
MIYNLGYEQNECNPDLMNKLIEEYNDSPHGTLSQIFEHKVSPNQVNRYMEEYIFITNLKFTQNKIIENTEPLRYGQKVQVYNPDSKFDKLKHSTLKGDWRIDLVDRESGKIRVKNQNNEYMKISPYFIQ